MLHLHRRKIILFFIFTLHIFLANAQHEFNRPDHDYWPYYFGLSISYNSSYLQTSKDPLFIQNDSILSVEPGASGGVALGLLATFRLSDRFEFRINPQLIVGGSKFFTYVLKYPLVGESVIEKKTLPSTIVSFPFQVKFNSDRINNFRVYMLTGLKYDIDLASNSAARNAQDLVKLSKTDFGYEAGVGFNFYMHVFTLSPELKISNGFSNVHSRDPSLKFSNVLDQLKSKMIVVSINLEE